MTKIINGFLLVIKIIFLLISFVITFNIVLRMYDRLDKNYVESVSVFLPYFSLFLVFAINLVFRQSQVNNCLFYNVTCCLVLCMLVFCGYRAMYDEYMLLYIRLGNYHINFNYYADMIAPLQVMLYLLTFSNIILMFNGKKEMQKVIAKKVS